MVVFCACGCKETINETDSRGRPRKYKNFHYFKLNKFPHPENTFAFKDGKYHHPGGYIMILIKDHPFANCDGYVMEHRLVMERHLGRYLTPEELVHHINGDKKDNRIENLELTDAHHHSKHHQYWLASPMTKKGSKRK